MKQGGKKRLNYKTLSRERERETMTADAFFRCLNKIEINSASKILCRDDQAHK